MMPTSEKEVRDENRDYIYEAAVAEDELSNYTNIEPVIQINHTEVSK